MARYKPYDLSQAKMIPLLYADQIVEGSFEHALNEIVEEHLSKRRSARAETARFVPSARVIPNAPGSALYASSKVERARGAQIRRTAPSSA